MVFRTTITMQKGGVGKTTTTKNLAGALANRGNDVLLIDADPQGGLTLKLGLREYYRHGDHTLFDVLADLGELSLDDLDQLVVEDWEVDESIADGHDGPEQFDVVPSHLRNFRLEKHLYSQPRGVESLRMALDRFDHDYDHVLVDSPPNLGPLADGALLATENVLFPAQPNTIAKYSLEILFDEIDTLEDRFTDDGVPKYQISTLGSVLNEVPSQGNVAADLREWFHGTFGEDFVFEVPDWDAVEHAIEYQSTVFSYYPEGGSYPWDRDKVEDLRETYDAIAAHLEGYA